MYSFVLPQADDLIVDVTQSKLTRQKENRLGICSEDYIDLSRGVVLSTGVKSIEWLTANYGLFT